MGFGAKWSIWLNGYLSSAHISVLVNGSPTSEFAPTRGLRQGDPLSPLLFNLVVDTLSRMIEKASEQGSFRGISLADNSNPLMHLQFADDTVIFMEDSVESISMIKNILNIFISSRDQK
ncbi:putative mitochondrial protein AtMg01250 [Apium graveolens]|uniref:putative mitochondrial protein AtMg01250 n=1 Tax=Apium graveolens TaxID=4045 RepID=UPI003D7A65BF